MGRFIFKIFFCLCFPVFAYASLFQEELGMYLQEARSLPSFGESVKAFSFSETSKTSLVRLLSFLEARHLRELEITERFKKFLEVPSRFLKGEMVQIFAIPFIDFEDDLQYHTLLFFHSGYDVILLKMEDYAEIQDFLKLDTEQKKLYLVEILKHVCENLNGMTNDQILQSAPCEYLLKKLKEVNLYIKRLQ